MNATDSNNDQSIKEKKTLEHPQQFQQSTMKTKANESTQYTALDNNPKTKQKYPKRPPQPQEDIAPKKQCNKSEKKPPPAVRFNTSTQHLPQIDKTRLVRCKNEGCENKKTYVFCPVCNVHLCICIAENRNCFTEFHMIKKTDA